MSLSRDGPEAGAPRDASHVSELEAEAPKEACHVSGFMQEPPEKPPT